LVFLKTMASYNPTSLTPSLFTEVPVLSPESEWSYICVLGISHFPISTIFLLYVWNFSDDVILFFHFIIGYEKRIMMMNLQQGLHEKFCKVEQYYVGERRIQPVHRYGERKATKGPVNLCRSP
jgi:hypothetical protein